MKIVPNNKLRVGQIIIWEGYSTEFIVTSIHGDDIWVSVNSSAIPYSRWHYSKERLLKQIKYGVLKII